MTDMQEALAVLSSASRQEIAQETARIAAQIAAVRRDAAAKIADLRAQARLLARFGGKGLSNRSGENRREPERTGENRREP